MELHNQIFKTLKNSPDKGKHEVSHSVIFMFRFCFEEVGNPLSSLGRHVSLGSFELPTKTQPLFLSSLVMASLGYPLTLDSITSCLSL